MTDRPWDHPAIARAHLISMARDYPDGVTLCVATCQCGWHFRVRLDDDGYAKRDDAIHAHWRDAIGRTDGDFL